MQPTRDTWAAMPSALATALREVIDDVVVDIDAAAHAMLAVVSHGEPWAAVCTNRDAGALNEIEQSSGGPAVDALRSGRIARITSTVRHRGWTDYLQACKQLRVGSVVALPIAIDSVRVAVMSVASNDYYAFGPAETRIGLTAATRAANILSGERVRSGQATAAPPTARQARASNFGARDERRFAIDPYRVEAPIVNALRRIS